jgi:hypothetical protein
MVGKNTKNTLLPLWMDHLYRNLPLVRDGLNLQDLPAKKEPCIVVGAGPSLKKLDQLNLIVQEKWRHPVLSCDRTLAACLKACIIPYATSSVDASYKIAGFYTSPIVRKYAGQMNAVFSGFADPKIIQKWKGYGGKIWWYTPMLDVPKDKQGKEYYDTQSYLLFLLTNGKPLMSGIGNVGAFLWNLAVALQCEPIILVGFDFSEQVLDIKDAVYFTSWVASFMTKYHDEKKACDAAAVLHQLETNPDFIATISDGHYFKKGEHPRYLINPIWKGYRNMLATHIVTAKKMTINATGNGCLHTQAKEGDAYILKSPYFKAQPLEEVLKEYG